MAPARQRVRSSSQQQGLGAVQRVLVLNGGRASLRLAQGLTVDDTEVLWTPWGPGAAVRSQWIELVNGMDVAPRWPGGDAPVLLEIAAQSAGRATPNSGQALPPQLSTFTTVQVPLGEWVEVAQLQSRQSSVSRSGFSAATSAQAAQPAGARQPAVVSAPPAAGPSATAPTCAAAASCARPAPRRRRPSPRSSRRAPRR